MNRFLVDSLNRINRCPPIDSLLKMVLKFHLAPCQGHRVKIAQQATGAAAAALVIAFTSSLKRPFASVSNYCARLSMASLHCDADTGGGIVALCSWAAHVLRNDASLSLPLATACSEGSWSRCLDYLQTGHMCQPMTFCPTAFVSLDTHRISLN